MLQEAAENTDMRRLTAGMLSEKCVVWRFRRRANVIECIEYTNVLVYITTIYFIYIR
jgi:hypothetical protein